MWCTGRKRDQHPCCPAVSSNTPLSKKISYPQANSCILRFLTVSSSQALLLKSSSCQQCEEKKNTAFTLSTLNYTD